MSVQVGDDYIREAGAGPRVDPQRENVQTERRSAPPAPAPFIGGDSGASAAAADNGAFAASQDLSTHPSLVVVTEQPPRRRLPRIRGRTMILRTRETFHNRWPFSIGVAEIAFGFLTLSLGILEIMVIPLVMDTDPDVRFEFKKSNCFGVGIWTGIMLILTGSLAVRASLGRRATTVYRFYLMTTITLFIYIIALVLLIFGFSSGWTPDTSPGEATAIRTIHSINAVAVFIGFLLALVAFIQYYEDVFCGELQLCRRLGKIFCPCCCPRCMDMYDESQKTNRKRGNKVPLDRYNRRTASQLV